LGAPAIRFSLSEFEIEEKHTSEAKTYEQDALEHWDAIKHGYQQVGGCGDGLRCCDVGFSCTSCEWLNIQATPTPDLRKARF
jgi:hypothetical protein